MIEEITVYRTMGKQFSTEKEALQYRDDMIGEFIDSIPGVILGPKAAIKITDFIVSNRKTLIKMLDY